MDALEVIGAKISIDDELGFLRFARRDRNVRLISWKADLNGPIYLSEKEIEKAYIAGNKIDFLLWNPGIERPLCWRPYLHNYDSNWEHINPNYAESIKVPWTEEEFLALVSSFRKQPITAKLFASGKIDTLLSPVIEISSPSIKDTYIHITADFTNWVNMHVWLVWNSYEQKWEHEGKNLSPFLHNHYEQPAEFLQWQENIFGWIRKNWADKIIPKGTYQSE